MPAGIVLFVCYMRTARAAGPRTLQEVGEVGRRTELVRRTFPKAAGYSHMDDPHSEALPADPAPRQAPDRAPLKQARIASPRTGQVTRIE